MIIGRSRGRYQSFVCGNAMNGAKPGDVAVAAEVRLAETFGYSTDLRSMTQGQGVFTMEFSKYKPTPGNIQKEIVEERKKAELAAAK